MTKEHDMDKRMIEVPMSIFLGLLDDSIFLEALLERGLEAWEDFDEVYNDYYGLEEEVTKEDCYGIPPEEHTTD